MSIPKPWPHQTASLKFAKTTPIVFDASDPGTGKTRVHIENFARRKKGRLLVIAPRNLLTSAWGNDIKQFAPQLSCTFAFADNRAAAFTAGSDVVAINTDGVKWLAENRKKYLKGFTDLVIDESTAFKHHTSQRSKAARVVSREFEFRTGMTGTPNANSVMELWHQILLLDEGKRLGDSYYRLRQVVQTPTQVGPSAQHLRWDDKPGIEPVIYELLKDITIRHAFEDVMKDVPANHVARYPFELSKKAKKVYDELESSAWVAMKDANITAVHAASLRTKLLQVASGAVYDDRGGYQVIDRQRYELVADLIEENLHSIAFFNWTHQRAEMERELDKRKINYAVIDGTINARRSAEIVDQFQAGKLTNILLHPKSAAHGLTLTRGQAAIWCSPVYEADLFKQGNHRIYRGGQTHATNTICVEAEGTVEQIVFERLTDKQARMEDFLSLLARKRG